MIVNLFYLLPEIILIFYILTIILFVLTRYNIVFSKNFTLLIYLIILTLEIITFLSIRNYVIFLFKKTIIINKYIILLKIIFTLISYIITILYYNRYYVNKYFKSKLILLLNILLISMLITMSYNILTFYIHIEIFSILSYILVFFDDKNIIKIKISLKYCLWGICCSAIMLYGLSYIYILNGDFNLIYSNDHYNKLIYKLGIYMFISGLLFKIGIFPLHFWISEVYSKNNFKIILILSTLLKYTLIFAFYNLIKQFIVYNIIDDLLVGWNNFITIIALFTISIGSINAIINKNIKNIISYISIHQTGILLFCLLYRNNDIMNYNLLTYIIVTYVVSNTHFIIILSRVYNYDSYHLLLNNHTIKYNIKIYILLFIIFLNLISVPPLPLGISKIAIIYNIIYTYYQYTIYNSIILIIIFYNQILLVIIYLKIMKNIFFNKIIFFHQKVYLIDWILILITFMLSIFINKII
ncbi:MAG: hypothetical protein IR527_02125 [Bacteroides sp.]|nr:MAG: hypothetical protein IR527_02125 [Bacteroides sp.]